MREKQKRCEVVKATPMGCGIFHYTLSCGHGTSRLGVIPRGRVMEQPARTVACHECSTEQARPTTHACPKCGGKNGYTFEMTETHQMFGGWGEEPEAGDSGINIKRTMPRCLDCGHRFRWATLPQPTRGRND